MRAAASESREMASKVMIRIARDLRKRETVAERILWAHLRDRGLGDLKFRRQYAVPNTTYVADFFCFESRLIVELDGSIHDTQQQADSDVVRQENLEAVGYYVIRFTNQQVYDDLESVLTDIINAHQEALNPQPLPPGGKGSQSRGLESPFHEGEGSQHYGTGNPFHEGEGSQNHGTGNPFHEGEARQNASLESPFHEGEARQNASLESPSPSGEGFRMRASGVSAFWHYAAAGRTLAALHLDYEKLDPFPLESVIAKELPLSYRVVDKMRLNKDKTALTVNPSLTLRGIPAAAFDYKLGNRSALEWVIDQYQVGHDKAGQVSSDPNRRDDPEYIVRLVGQVIRVSIETSQVINALPDEPTS